MRVTAMGDVMKIQSPEPKGSGLFMGEVVRDGRARDVSYGAVTDALNVCATLWIVIFGVMGLANMTTHRETNLIRMLWAPFKR
jgi:hypothetical protein